MRSREIARNIAEEVNERPEKAAMFLQLMELVARLEGVALTREQYFGGSVIGSAVDVYDAAFDKYDVTQARRNGELLDQALSAGPISDELDPRLRRSIEIAQETLEPAALEAMRRLNAAQIRSIEQRTNTRVAEDTLKLLTREKGAAAVTLVAVEVNPAMSVERRQCYEEFGYLVQLIDDHIDRNVDAESGLVTLATNPGSQDMINLIREQYQKTKKAFIDVYGELKSKEILKYIEGVMARGGFGVI